MARRGGEVVDIFGLTGSDQIYLLRSNSIVSNSNFRGVCV